ncbi:MAG: right-handed parallel beta-helix repeat-containing protein [Cyclobacteriaceae bacterium]|nr:right-handed parallel beta-helix repeat-containing protein [Cyclobacteriaceae bacterium]
MNIFRIFLLLTAIILLFACSESKEKNTFYVDAAIGSDTNSGTDPDNAWQTLAKINATDFEPGDNILLKKGQIFHGSLVFDEADAGSESNPIAIGSYGGAYYSEPIIESGDAFAIKLQHCSWVNISGLVIHGAGRKTAKTSGLMLEHCTNMNIDSVRASGYQHHGIDVLSSENIRITHIKANDNGKTGIRVGGDRIEGTQDFSSRNIYIGYSDTYDNAGDPTVMDNHSGSGIIVNFTDSAVIEYCSAYNNGWDMPRKGNGPVGIWAHDANNITIQYCIAYNNEAPRGAWDGGGFDFDGGITNSVMQYNYSYDNNGAGYGLFQYAGTTVWENNTIRFNISYNDGEGREFTGLCIWTAEPDKDLLRNCRIYNNVIVNELGSALKFAMSDEGKASDPPGFEFYNNIFISSDEPINGTYSKSLFSHNAWWRLDNEKIRKNPDAFGRYENPGLQMPTPDNYRITDPAMLKSLDVFRTVENSPCKGTGKSIPENGGTNFWGEPLTDVQNIGVE